MSRYHLAITALQRASRIRYQAPGLIAELENLIARARDYAREHLEDAPEIRDWTWSWD
jgi:xylulose-5-phosphate/fructose-6-phosphate phosphoketolase